MTDPVQLRIRAEDLMRAEDDEGLLGLVCELRADELWTRMWAPGCAIAAGRLGRTEEGRGYLEEAIDGGFFQPEIFEGEIEKVFAARPDWPDVAARIAANLPPAPLELLAWPALTPKPPLRLYRMGDDREEQLRALLPELTGSAWDRALTLLHWVTRRWTHANDHVDEETDALEVLKLVDGGMRFACVEYSIVLCHALNASGIPSRRLSLRQKDHHAGWGKGHVTSEAWIDDLGGWVILDGQNGAYWSFGDAPLSALDLQAALAEGRRPDLLTADGPMKPAAADWWFTYFHHISTTGATWAAPLPFVPHFQQRLNASQPLLAAGEQAYPDLAEVGVRVDVRDDAAALRFTDRHPFSIGYAIQAGEQRDVVDAADPVWLLPAAAGAYAATVSVRTALGELAPQRLEFRVASSGGEGSWPSP